MKITFITTLEAYWGGSEELWVRCAEYAISKGHEVQVVYYKQNELHPLLINLKNKAASYLELRKDLQGAGLFGKAVAAVKNRIYATGLKKVEEFNPDCILVSQVNNYSAPFHPLIFSFLRKFTRPFYLISQFNFDHFCLPYSDIEKARELFSKASRIYFVSQRNKLVTERQLARRIPNFRIIDNPLNLNDISYVSYPGIKEKVNFASVARLEANFKGQDILLEILSGESWKERNWHLNIYGTGPDEAYLKELSHFYNLQDKVTFHGQVREIRKIWEINHCLVMPSVAEGKPLALEEAMVCGRIGIVSDVAGNAELTDDGINGFIASSFLPQPFSRAMEKAWNNKENWEEMGKLAHDKMLRVLDFSPQSTIIDEIEKSS
jgi:L-malate glycosyltransferase